MAKVKNEATEGNEEPAVEKVVSKITKKKSTIQLRNPDSKIGLWTKRGKRVWITLEEALSEHYQKQLTEKSLLAVSSGKTALQLAKEGLNK